MIAIISNSLSLSNLLSLPDELQEKIYSFTPQSYFALSLVSKKVNELAFLGLRSETQEFWLKIRNRIEVLSKVGIITELHVSQEFFKNIILNISKDTSKEEIINRTAFLQEILSRIVLSIPFNSTTVKSSSLRDFIHQAHYSPSCYSSLKTKELHTSNQIWRHLTTYTKLAANEENRTLAQIMKNYNDEWETRLKILLKPLFQPNFEPQIDLSKLLVKK